MEHSPKLDHTLGYETSLNKFKEIEIVESISLTTMERNYKLITKINFGYS